MNDIKAYKRNVTTTKAEEVLNKSKIFINRVKLTEYVKTIGKDDTDAKKFLLAAVKGDGFVSTKYTSKNILTARLFTKSGHLNTITLNSKGVLSSMESRYPDGRVLCFDYSNYEMVILSKLLGVELHDDLHLWAANTLGINRREAKNINMQVIFSGSLSKAGAHITNEEYRNYMQNLLDRIYEYTQPFMGDFEKYGYVITPYDRKIYPKRKGSVFSSIIQSVGADILSEVIVKVANFGEETHLLFHRFDCLYFDMSKRDLYENLLKLKNVIENTSLAKIRTNIRIGRDLTSLVELRRSG